MQRDVTAPSTVWRFSLNMICSPSQPLRSVIAGALLLATTSCADRPAPPTTDLATTGARSGPQALRFEDVSFHSHSTKLAGTLVWPEQVELSAAVVFVHGSGRQERSLGLAKAFAAHGVAALVYDKRGVGESEGEYEQEQNVSGSNISLLADDAVAALQALSRHASIDVVPLGFAGISQAGWIAPLAAERTPLAQFIVLWSGPVCKVSEEDIFSKYTADHDSDEVPSYEEVLASRQDPYIWPDFLGTDTDPSQSLEKLSIPGLWIFGGRDGSVPVDLSMLRLDELREQGFRYEYRLFSELGHNNMNETFSMAVDWIKRQGLGPPGNSRTQ